MSETILKIKQCEGEIKRYHSRKTNMTSQLEMFKTAGFLLEKKKKNPIPSQNRNNQRNSYYKF